MAYATAPAATTETLEAACTACGWHGESEYVPTDADSRLEAEEKLRRAHAKKKCSAMPIFS